MKNKLSAIFIGEPYFCKKIVNSLNEYCKKNNLKNYKFYYINTRANLKGNLSFIPLLIKSKVLISVKGYINRKNEYDIAFFLNKKMISFWMGTDVQKAYFNFTNGNYVRRNIDKVYHLCACQWIKDELKNINIEAKILNLVSIKIPEIIIKKRITDQINTNNIDYTTLNNVYENNNSKFIIFTYIGNSRPNFYGLGRIVNIAKDLNNYDIEFKVAGIDKNTALKSFPENMKLPENIIFLGYINNMSFEYINSHIYMRLVEHDGLATSVLEALSYGKHVIYTYKFPFTINTNNNEDTKNIILNYYSKYKNKELKANTDGAKFVIENYYEDVINKKIIELLNDLI